ncbi:MAG: hypothetical protein V1835_05030 [Candidatus Micrarchaeota archaeon]
MVQEFIAGGFIVAHLLAAAIAIQMVRRGNKLLILMALMHLGAIPLVFVFFELVSIISFPLIMVTLIAFILEDKPGKGA